MATAPAQIAPAKAVSPPARKSSPPEKLSCEVLSPAEYPLWDELVRKSSHGTVFHHSWWLAITASAFRILGVRNTDGKLVGGIPLPFRTRGGFRLLHSPALAPYLGPIFDLSDEDGICDQLHLMRSGGEALATGIGSFDSFRCVAGANAPDLQGLLWAGFNVSLAYTFRFSSTQTLEEITKAMTRTHLQKLSKAKRLNLQVVRDAQIESLIELNRMTFDRKGTSAPFSPALVANLWAASHSRGRANLYIAQTEDAVPIAALLTVHDDRTTYQIISGFHPGFSDVPGQNFILWMAIQDAIAAGRNYDFEGSGIRGVETFYRRWGCAAFPVWRIEKAGSLRGTLAHLAIRYRDRYRSRVSSSR